MQFFLISLFSLITSYAQAGNVACMSYEQALNNGCSLANSEKAFSYCASKFGVKYTPYEIDGKNCTEEIAAKSRGEVSAEKLVDGLSSDMDEIETIITMIDRQGKNGVLGSNSFEITNEFYTDVVKTLMAKMNSFKKELHSRGQLNIRITTPGVDEYISLAFRYLDVLKRLYRVYSAAAHENHFVLNSYKFENLEYLNLVLKKEYGLEILAKVNYGAKTLNNGNDIEFIVSQQERQTYEYLSMQTPSNEKDYAKLVTFLGIRETVTNLWGVQRMSSTPLEDGVVRSCGNFLSFRPENNSILESKAYTELYEADIFYNEYFPRQKDLIKATQNISLLDRESSIKMELFVFEKVEELRDLAKATGRSEEQLAIADAPILVKAESMYWKEFSVNFFTSIVMPGDGVLNKKNIINRIVEEAYKRRLESIKDTFIGSYLWISDKAIDDVEGAMTSYADKYLKDNFYARLSQTLDEQLSDFLNDEDLARKNKSKKIEETFKTAQASVKAAYILNLIEDKMFNPASSLIIEPSTVEELMLLFESKVAKDFADIKATLEHNEELSKELAKFFKEVEKKFKARFINAGGLIGTQDERSKGLREIAFNEAKEWIKKFPFVVLEPKTKNILLEEEDGIPVYEDGTPAALSNEELLKKLDQIRIGQGPVYKSDKDTWSVMELFGSTEPVKESKRIRVRSNPDKISTGELGRPLEVVSPGVIRTNSGDLTYDESTIIRLFERFKTLSQEVLEEERSVTRSEPSSNKKSELTINDPRKFFFRVFEVLNLERALEDQKLGSFSRDEASQNILANNIVSQAYQAAPILRIEHDYNKNVRKYCFTRGAGTPYRCDYKEKKSISLLKVLAYTDYSSNSNELNSASSKEMIEQTIYRATRNASNKVSTFCKANFMNYKIDPNFKKVYKSSKFLRTNLKNPMGQSQETVENIQRFDENIRKNIRSRSEAVNEDFLEPTLHILGTAALVALGVVLMVGSGGVAAPGLMGGAFASASTFLAIEFFVSFPLMVGSLYSRINTNFIEVPAQLKFQQSLATSQIDSSKVVDWDGLKADKEAASSQKGWTIGLMPLDFFYGAMLWRHVKVETGSVGNKAYERLTGVKLKGWSAPTSGVLNLPSFHQMRKHRGILSAGWALLKKPLVKIKSYMPRYVPVPESMIRTTALRSGIVRKAQSLDISNKPWELLGEIDAYTSKLKDRLINYKSFVKAQNKLESTVRLRGSLSPSELLSHFDKSMISFMPKTLWRKIKTGSVKEVGDFFFRFGDVWREMKKAQGIVIGERAKKIDSLADKLREFKRAVEAGKYKGEDKMEEFLRLLSDQEILMLEEVAKKSHGVLAHFKTVFKDYQKVVHGLRPMGYLTGYPGRNFQESSEYPAEFFKGEVVDMNGAFESDAQDLIKFYESLMKNQALKTEELSKLREKLESELSSVAQ